MPRRAVTAVDVDAEQRLAGVELADAETVARQVGGQQAGDVDFVVEDGYMLGFGHGGGQVLDRAGME